MLRRRRRKLLEEGRLDSQVWTKLKKNRLSMISIFTISFFILVAILGYLITPDSTPFSNQQYLELSTLKPGKKISFLKVENRPHIQKQNLIKLMAYGSEEPFTLYPIHISWEEGKLVYAETYTGEDPNRGDTISFDRSKHSVSLVSKRFILGTDRYGRDILSQLMIGSRVSLSVGLIAILISLIIGISLGAIAGYYGGWVDNLIVWLINVIWSIPTILLVIAITFALGKGFWQVFVAVGLTMWVDVARIVRGQVISLKEKEFVEAAKALGFKDSRIIIRHILPNLVGPITVITASNFATAILQEAGLSFLGLGVQPPMPSWGTMIKENYGYIILDAAYMAIIPGLAIMILVLSFLLLGSGLRQAMDVKT